MSIESTLEKCSECNAELRDVWLTLKKKNYCSDCWAKMKDPPKIKCFTPDQIGSQDPKWRGIKTTQQKKNEVQALTITNRLGQKSMSLPRIDDKKRWAGFPGLAGTARKIAFHVPKCETYVEPFAGSAKVFQELFNLQSLKAKRFILNDKSKFVNEWLKREFQRRPTINVTNTDFKYCMKKYDSEKTFFLIDFPWVKSFYDQGFASFNRESVKDYSEEVLDLCRNLKGKFMITTREENKILRESEFDSFRVKSEYVVSGKYPIVLVTTNVKGMRDYA